MMPDDVIVSTSPSSKQQAEVLSCVYHISDRKWSFDGLLGETDTWKCAQGLIPKSAARSFVQYTV